MMQGKPAIIAGTLLASLVVGLVLPLAVEPRLSPSQPLAARETELAPTQQPTPCPTTIATYTPTRQPSPTPTHTLEPMAAPRGHLEAAVILHSPSSFPRIDDILAPNDVSSVPIEAYAGEPIPDLTGYDAVILSGGEYSSGQFDSVPFLQAERGRVMEAIDQGVPILGISMGHQLLAHWLGGRVERGPQLEVGWLEVTIDEDGLNDPLLQGLDGQFYGFLWHRDQVTQLPSGAINLASSDLCPNQAFRYQDLPVWGVQFNPEYDAALAESALLGASWLADIGVDTQEMAIMGYEVDDGSQGRIFSNFFTFSRSR